MTAQPDHDAPAVDPDAAIAFLLQLRPKGPWPLTAIIPNGPTRTITATDAKSIRAFVLANSGARNLYFSANPTTGPIRSKAKKSDIAAAEYVFADLDPRDDETPEAAKARYLARLETFEPKATAIIDSGNGIQSLWRLTDPVPPDRFAEVEARTRATILALDGPPGTQNVDRVLRLPGTVNLPNKTKLKAGRIPCEAKLIHFSGGTHPLTAFPVEDKSAPPKGEKRKTKSDAAAPNSIEVQEIIKAGGGARFKDDRSDGVWFVANQLTRRGFSEDGIVAILLDRNNRLSDHIYDQPQPEVYARRQAAKALAEKPQRPLIRVEKGKIARTVKETEKALIAAGRPVFNRGGILVEPIYTKMPAPNAPAGEVDVTVFRQLQVESLRYMINNHAADYIQYNGAKKRDEIIDPPPEIVKTLLTLGHWGFPRVTGIINAPTIRPDGTILDQPGYDPATHLWYAPDRDLILPPVPDRPTKDAASAALKKLKDLIRESPFVSDLDRSVALAGMLTAVLRGGFNMAPMILFRAHSPGSGKSFLVDLIAHLVTGRWCPVAAVPPSQEEFEKRLGALALKSPPIMCLDNCTVDLGGNALCHATERPSFGIRILGKSEMPEVEWRASMFATGNNVTFFGDMTRRGLTCNIDAGLERPELRPFKSNPLKIVSDNRAEYLAAILTIARAYSVGKGRVKCSSFGSYEAWSRVVREPLIWLGEPDPVKSLDQAREDDPEKSAARALIELWKEKLEVGRHYKAAEIVEFAIVGELRVTKDGPEWKYTHPDFHALLVKEAGSRNGRDVDVQRFGRWLGKLNGQVHSGHRIVKVRASKGHGDDWALVEAPAPKAKG